MTLDGFFNSEAWDGPHTEVQCKRALHPSGLPGINYALNPYGGCTHGCVYCYAPEVTHAEWKDWRAVRVKINIAERLAKEIGPLSGTIGIGTVTDPYQDPERRFEITRSCLSVISRTDMHVNIMTKSDLVLRDVDIISKIPHAVGITVTNTDDRASKITEPGAPLPSVRFSALKRLREAGINAYVLVGPIMSTLAGRERELADAILETGVKYASVDRLNPRPLLSERLSRMNICPAPDSVELLKRYLAEGGICAEDAFS